MICGYILWNCLKYQCTVVHWIISEHTDQWRSQNAEKVTHIKRRLLDQAMILFDCVPFQMGTSLKGKNCSQRELILSFKSSFLWYGKITFTTLGGLP